MPAAGGTAPGRQRMLVLQPSERPWTAAATSSARPASVRPARLARCSSVTLLCSLRLFVDGMGGNETLIGKAIKGYPRKDVCIASKVRGLRPAALVLLLSPQACVLQWSITSTAPITLDFSAANAHKTINEQLERLSVEFLDVMASPAWVCRSRLRSPAHL